MPATVTDPLQPSVEEPDTGPFWAATAAHRLTYQVCRDCDEVVFYPRGHCTHCGGRHLDWRDSAGQGTLYTYSVVRANRQPGLAELVPYAVAYVDLDEGFRLLTRLVDIDPADIRIGARVRVTWRDIGQVSLPEFAPTP